MKEDVGRLHQLEGSKNFAELRPVFKGLYQIHQSHERPSHEGERH